MRKLLSILSLSALALPVLGHAQNNAAPAGAAQQAEGADVSASLVTAEVLPGLDEPIDTIARQEIEELKALVEAQLAKMPELKGVYVGIIRAHGADDKQPPQIELLRVAQLDVGENHLTVADAEGTFSVQMVLAPNGPYWTLDGSVGYRWHEDPTQQTYVKTSMGVPEGVSIMGGLGNRALRALLAEKQGLAKAEEAYSKVNGFFCLRTADAVLAPSAAAATVQGDAAGGVQSVTR